MERGEPLAKNRKIEDDGFEGLEPNQGLDNEFQMNQMADQGIDGAGEPWLFENADNPGFPENQDLLQQFYDEENGGMDQNNLLAHQNMPNEPYNNHFNDNNGGYQERPGQDRDNDGVMPDPQQPGIQMVQIESDEEEEADDEAEYEEEEYEEVIDEEDPRHERFQDAHLLSIDCETNGLQSIKLIVRDALTLARTKFLSDQIIHYMFAYIATKLMKKERLAEVLFFETFFWTQLTYLRDIEDPNSKRLSFCNRQSSSGDDILSMDSEEEKELFEEEEEDGPKIMENVETMVERMKRRNRRKNAKNKNVDIFSYKYLVVPVLEESHWMLAIIVNPGACIVETPVGCAPEDSSEDSSDNASEDASEDASEGAPKDASDNASEVASEVAPEDCCYILFFDPLTSMARYRSNRCSFLLANYLNMWYAKTHEEDGSRKVDLNRIKWVSPKNLPVQNNGYDCGLFILNYVEGFFTHIIHSRHTVPVEEIINLDWNVWYPEGSKMADLMRDKVYNIIARDSNPHALDRLSRYDRMFNTSGISTEGASYRRSRRHSAHLLGRRHLEQPVRRSFSADPPLVDDEFYGYRTNFDLRRAVPQELLPKFYYEATEYEKPRKFLEDPTLKAVRNMKPPVYRFYRKY